VPRSRIDSGHDGGDDPSPCRPQNIRSAIPALLCAGLTVRDVAELFRAHPKAPLRRYWFRSSANDRFAIRFGTFDFAW